MECRAVSMILVLIAASYTPVTLLAVRAAFGIAVLVLARVGALVGIVVTIARLERWRGLGLVMYLGLGWLAVVAAPQLATSLSRAELVLLVAGGVLYTGGAVLVAPQPPTPSPTTVRYPHVWPPFLV